MHCPEAVVEPFEDGVHGGVAASLVLEGFVAGVLEQGVGDVGGAGEQVRVVLGDEDVVVVGLEQQHGSHYLGAERGGGVVEGALELGPGDQRSGGIVEVDDPLLGERRSVVEEAGAEVDAEVEVGALREPGAHVDLEDLGLQLGGVEADDGAVDVAVGSGFHDGEVGAHRGAEQDHPPGDKTKRPGPQGWITSCTYPAAVVKFSVSPSGRLLSP